jgi:hypothetical protein
MFFLFSLLSIIYREVPKNTENDWFDTL